MNKIKLLILLLVLVNGFLIGTVHAKWVIDTNSCKIWIDDDNSKISNSPIKWSGLCKNSFAEGNGEIEYNFLSENEVKSCQGEVIKGKLQGHIKCLINNGNTFSGTMQSDNVMGQGVYTWKSNNCPTCFHQYTGTFHKNKFAAVGTLALVNGKKLKILFYPDQKGCLVWNNAFEPNEVIKWSGKCKDGYASGKGTLTYALGNRVEVFKGSLLNGKMDGNGIVSIMGPKCSDCVIKFKGTFKNHQAINGVATLGDGRTIQQNSAQQVLAEQMMMNIVMGGLMNQVFYDDAFPGLNPVSKGYFD